MTEAQPPGANNVNGLQLVGKESKAGLNTTSSDSSAESKNSFSNELQLATHDVKMQADAEDTQSGATPTKGTSSTNIEIDMLEFASSVDEKEAPTTVSSAGDSPVLSQPKAELVTTQSSLGIAVTDGSDTKEKVTEKPVVSERVDESEATQSSLGIAVTDGSDTKEKVTEKPVVSERVDESEATQSSLGIAVTDGSDTQEKATEKPVVSERVDESEAPKPGNADLNVSNKAQQPPTSLEIAPVAVADSSASLQNQSVGNPRNSETLTPPERIAGPASPESKQIAETEPTGKLLTGTTSDSDKSKQLASSAASQTMAVVEKKDPHRIVKHREPTVKSGTLPVVAQSQTVAQLPAAVALNATSRSIGAIMPMAENNEPTAQLNTTVVPPPAQTAAGSLTSPGMLAQNHAYAIEVPASTDGVVQLAGGLMTPAGVTTASETANSQAALPAAMVKQVHPGIVEAEGADTAVALNNALKPAIHAAQQSVQVAEPLVQSATSGVAEPANNMFQALPNGIITAPVVQRSEFPANLVTSAPYTVPLPSGDADEALAGNVRWMVAGGVKNAVVNIAPSGMGPISVQIDIENEQLNVSIIATQGGTREALDALLPRLREQLGTQGLDSVRVEVSDGRSEGARNSAGQQFGQARSDLSGNTPNNSGADTESDEHANDRPDNETQRQRASDMQHARLGFTGGDRQHQSLFDAYV